MAVTKLEGGWTLAAAGDVADDPGGKTIIVNRVIVVKATAGTVTFKDGDGDVCLLTNSLGDGSMTQIDFGGMEVTGLEMDAISAGTATAYVYGTIGGRTDVK